MRNGLVLDKGTSPNMALNEAVHRRRANGEQIVHLGFGEARLPSFGPLEERLVLGAVHSGYGPVAGSARFRGAVAGYFGRRGIPTTAEQIVAGPGSKPLLMAVQMATAGAVLIPRPAWNTYAPQVTLAGKRPYGVPIPDGCGGVPDPVGLRRVLDKLRNRGERPGGLILTVPDNPTGTLAAPRTIERVCRIVAEEGMFVVSDEIYRDLVHDSATRVLSPSEILPERTVVTTGLSKNLGLGGWRIGAARFPRGPWGEAVRRDVVSLASELWSTLAAPMQEVAAYAFDEPEELRAHLGDVVRLHAGVAREVHRVLVRAGALCRRPDAGFYLYPDLEPHRSALGRHGIVDSPSLQEHLLEAFGIAVLGGHNLGDDPSALRFRVATSLLYGETDEELWAALRAPDPVAVPHIASSLTRVEEALGKLCQ